MNKLSLILGGIALGAVGYGLKKWYDQTKEENAYWTDDPLDIAGEMAQEGANWLEKKLFSSDSPTPEDSAENSEAKVEAEGIKENFFEWTKEKFPDLYKPMRNPADPFFQSLEDSAENSEAVKEQAGEMAQEAKVETEGIK